MHNLFSDPARHWENGINFFEAGLMGGMDPIGYQVWLKFISLITSQDETLIAIYTSILSVFTPFIWYKVVQKIIPNKPKLTLLAWLIFSLLPSWLHIFSYFMNETLLLPLFGLALYFSYDYKNWFSICLSWILASLTRIIILPIGLINIAYIFYKKPSKNKILVLIIVWLLFITPSAYRAHSIINSFSPFGYSKMNQIYCLSGRKTIKLDYKDWGIWEFSSPALYTNSFEPFNLHRSPRDGVEEVIINSSEDWNNYLKELKPNFKNIILENFIYLFFNSSWPDSPLDQFWGKLNFYSRWLWFPMFLSICFGNLYYFIRFKKLPLLAVQTMVLSILLLFNTMAVMEGRYRKPLEGLMLLNLFWLLGNLPIKLLGNLTIKKGAPNSRLLYSN